MMGAGHSLESFSLVPHLGWQRRYLIKRQSVLQEQALHHGEEQGLVCWVTI